MGNIRCSRFDSTGSTPCSKLCMSHRCNPARLSIVHSLIEVRYPSSGGMLPINPLKSKSRSAVGNGEGSQEVKQVRGDSAVKKDNHYHWGQVGVLTVQKAIRL